MFIYYFNNYYFIPIEISLILTDQINVICYLGHGSRLFGICDNLESRRLLLPTATSHRFVFLHFEVKFRWLSLGGHSHHALTLCAVLCRWTQARLSDKRQLDEG